MAYIIGLVTPEEKATLKRRGWDIETPPREMAQEKPVPNMEMVMVWVDSNLFQVMSGPDWDTQEG